MTDIGVVLDAESLVLTRGRDFRWVFENQDPITREAVDFPAGDLFFELQTRGEKNSVQQVTVNAASGGTYKLGFGGHSTGDIPFSDVTNNPQNISGDITDFLEATTGIGVGNVSVRPSSLIPVWELTFTLNAGHNEIQKITFNHTIGGTFVLVCGANATSPLTYGASAATVQTALQGLTSIGSGNCTVTADATGYTVEFIGGKANTNMPQIVGLGIGLGFLLLGDSALDQLLPNKITTSTIVGGTSKLSAEMVNALNQSINDFFNGFEALLGVDINVVITDDQNLTLTVTSKKSYDESGLVTFAIDIASTTIESVLNGVSSFLGVFDTIHVDFYWKHTYVVEFINALGLQPQPALIPDITSLTGVNSEQSVTVTQLQLGKTPTTKWPFTIVDDTATLKVESEDADIIPQRMLWQLVFLPSGESAGGDPIAAGRVRVQAPDSYVKSS